MNQLQNLITRPIPALAWVILLVPVSPTIGIQASDRPPLRSLSAEDSSFVSRARDTHGCPCGCGSELPGSRQGRACFGCSVGKAEITRLYEGLAAGESKADLLVSMGETVIVDVFPDYTERNLERVWEMAREVAGKLQVRRVVLRTPGRTRDARRAVAVAECARSQGRFSDMRAALLAHRGPWDERTLLGLAQSVGLDTAVVFDCLQTQDVQPQVVKDRQHATERNLRRLPAVTVNRIPVKASREALRKALTEALSLHSY